MSEFDDPKRRVVTPTQPTFHHHHHRRKEAADVPAKGAVAPHNALQSLPPDRHQYALGKPLLTYRDLPPPVPETARVKGSSIEPPTPSLQEMEAALPPETVGSVLQDTLRAAKELLTRREP